MIIAAIVDGLKPLCGGSWTTIQYSTCLWMCSNRQPRLYYAAAIKNGVFTIRNREFSDHPVVYSVHLGDPDCIEQLARFLQDG